MWLLSGRCWEWRTADCLPGANKIGGTTRHDITIRVTHNKRQRIFADAQNNQMTANRTNLRREETVNLTTPPR